MPRHIIGVIAEFDPFHRGHEHLIRQAKAACPAAPVVVAMSGHFTQRGGAAALAPHARGEMALNCGADLVLELPLPWAISSAEGFARGGVSVLKAAGADTLAFGSECGDLARLERAAEGLERPDYPALLHSELASGCSFAAARQRALSALIGAEDAALLERPNDLLGISYLSAIRETGAGMEALAVPRIGPGHNEEKAEAGFASASAIRRLLVNGDCDRAETLLPEAARPILRREWEAGRAPAHLRNAERAMLYRLRRMTEADFAALPDCAEGLENRLYRAAQQATSPEQFYELAKTKRYAHARIRRMALWAFLGLTAADRPQDVPYLRVLGMNEAGQAVLHSLKDTCPLPIITKPASAKMLSGEAGRLFAETCRAADLWQLCLPMPGPCGSGWTTGPVIRRSPESGWD